MAQVTVCLVHASQRSSVYSKLAASAYLCRVHLASLQTKVCDRIAAIQVHSCFVISLCSRHIVLKTACRQERAGGRCRSLVPGWSWTVTARTLMLLTSRDKNGCTRVCLTCTGCRAGTCCCVAQARVVSCDYCCFVLQVQARTNMPLLAAEVYPDTPPAEQRTKIRVWAKARYLECKLKLMMTLFRGETN